METPQTPSSTRRGTPGLDIFKIAGQSISGYLPSLKGAQPRPVRQPYTSLLELSLALYQVSDSNDVRVILVLHPSL